MMQKMEITAIAVAAALIAGAAVASLAASIRNSRPKAPLWGDAHIACVIEAHPRTDSTGNALLTGYNYQLLKDMARDLGVECSIRLSERGQSEADSLRSGDTDILVIPYTDSLDISGTVCSTPVDSMSLWLMKDHHRHELSLVNKWIAEYHASDSFQPTRKRFLNTYNPYLSGKRSYLSPYDSLVKASADSIGWDWRLLTAIMYRESYFHIEARSSRGAKGLMQIMPSSAAGFGVDDILDPAQSIDGGARMLKYLSNMFKGTAANQDELVKFTLGAYNAGQGRILDGINYAKYKGMDPSLWDNVAGLFPEMRDSSILAVDAVKLGLFTGGERTSRYVSSVLDAYEEFKRIIQQ